MTEIIKNAIIKSCTFENNTLYQVLVVDYDGTHPLNPGDSQKNILVKGLGVNLVMKFEHGEVNIRFPSRRYENRRHMMSVVFKDEIQKLERNETDSKTKDDEHPGDDIYFNYPNSNLLITKVFGEGVMYFRDFKCICVLKGYGLPLKSKLYSLDHT